jgi:hypothetical protein
MRAKGGARKKYKETIEQEVHNWLFIWILYGTVSTLRTRSVNLILEGVVNNEIWKNLERNGRGVFKDTSKHPLTVTWRNNIINLLSGSRTRRFTVANTKAGKWTRS